MNQVASVIADLVQDYFRSARSAERECRLLVPGITQSIAEQIQARLKQAEIPSYLVINRSHEPDEGQGWLYSDGLTSKREGSFVIVVCPGEQAYIQDSVKGAGGTIRSTAFSDEWPWIDNGNEFFQFDGPFLDRLLAGWDTDEENRRWLREFITGALVPALADSHARADILADLLGAFDPSRPSGIESIRGRFLFHCGVPWSQLVGTPDCKAFIKEVNLVCNKVSEESKDVGIREEIQLRVGEVREDDESQRVLISHLHTFFDGFGQQVGLAGPMALAGSFRGPEKLGVWESLDCDTLKALFEVDPAGEVSLDWELRADRGIQSESGTALAAFHGDSVVAEIRYRVGGDPESCRIRVVHGQRVLAEATCAGETGAVALQIDTATIQHPSKRLSLKAQLILGDHVVKERRGHLHLCGDSRPAFMVIMPGFHVADPTPGEAIAGDDVDADARHLSQRVEVDRPAFIYLFTAEPADEPRLEIDDEPADTEYYAEGIGRSVHPVDPSDGQVLVSGTFAIGRASRVLEAPRGRDGEFTLEDELREQLVRGGRTKLRLLLRHFTGEATEPYTGLGGVKQARRRVLFATAMEQEPDGYLPVLADLCSSVCEDEIIHAAGCVRCAGQLDTHALRHVNLTESASQVVDRYAMARHDVLQVIGDAFYACPDAFDRPLYAALPTFVERRRTEIEAALTRYLDAYRQVIDVLNAESRSREWGEIFVLSYLDCVVNWSRDDRRVLFCLMGPWHPLVLAKRFMVQHAIHDAAVTYLGSPESDGTNRLAVLLDQVDGVRWHYALSADGNSMLHAYVSATSDPGWLLSVAVRSSSPRDADPAGVHAILADTVGITPRSLPLQNDHTPRVYIKGFAEAHPARRSLSIRAGEGYSPEALLAAASSSLYDGDDPTELAAQLPGGLHLFVNREPACDALPWREPPVCAYVYETDEECFRDRHIDVLMLPPRHSVGFSEDRGRVQVPRGDGDGTAFLVPLMAVSESAFGTPVSVAHEADYPSPPVNKPSLVLGDAFLRAIAAARQMLPNAPCVSRALPLPAELHCSWTVIPGLQVDPAVFVKYIRDGYERGIQERALWEYKVDIAGGLNSYYVLSTIPRGFSAALNDSRLFDDPDAARAVIRELGEIGVAIGGEVMKSGRRALGVLGLVAAVRLLMGNRAVGSPLLNDESHAGFVLPVDSFYELFGGRLGASSADTGKRADLLAVQLSVPGEDGPVQLSACAVECKYVSGVFPDASVERALGQAQDTYDRLVSLAEAARKRGGMPARLALVNLVAFGLRLCATADTLSRDSRIIESLLRGNFDIVEASASAVLVTLECGLAESRLVDDLGLWVRLSPRSWPGVTATSAGLDHVRHRLSDLFGRLAGPVVRVPVESSPSSEAPDSESSSRGEQPGAGPEPALASQAAERTPPAPPEVPRAFLGNAEVTERWTLIGRLPATGQRVALDLDHPKAVGVFGYMGSGKSYLLGTLLESALVPIAHINSLPSPLAVVVFNYRRQYRDRFELSSLVVPNGNREDVARLAEYDALPQGLGDLHVLCLPGELNQDRVREYAGLQASELYFDPQTLTVEDWELLMGEPGSDAVFARTIRMGLQDLRHAGSISLQELQHYLSSRLRGGSLSAAQLRLDFVRRYLSAQRGVDFQQLIRPGRAVIIDLRQPLFNKDDALRFFLICANYVSQVQGSFNKMVVFDEAHEYLSEQFGERMEARIRQMRHEGTTYVFATQDVGSIPASVRRFISTRFVFNLGTHQNAEDLVRFAPEFRSCQLTGMRPGLCLAQGISSVAEFFGQPRQVEVRPRVTQHGGETRIFSEPSDG